MLAGLSVRYVHADGADLVAALHAGLHSGAAPIIAVVPPGMAVDRHLALRLSNMFASDFLGAAGKCSSGDDVDAIVVTARDVNYRPRALIREVANRSRSTRVLAVRRATLEEVGGARRVGAGADAMADLMLRVANKGWHVSLDGNRALEGRVDKAADGPTPAWAQSLAEDIGLEREQQPFSRIRLEHEAAFGETAAAVLADPATWGPA